MIFAVYIAGCADLGFQQKRRSSLSLTWPIVSGNSKEIRKRIENGANPDGSADSGQIPLMLAAWMGNNEAVSALLDGGAQVNKTNKHGATAVMAAIANGHPETGKLLVKRGAKMDGYIGNTIGAYDLCRFHNIDGLCLDSYQAKTAQLRNQRTSEEIVGLLSLYSLGLNVIYNNYLVKRPGFSGKITLKFSIGPSGKVLDSEILQSSTKYAEFDDKIEEEVESWTFNPISASENDVITVPFTFSE